MLKEARDNKRGWLFILQKESRMTHIITSLCVRDRGCIEVCPVECMVPGFPK